MTGDLCSWCDKQVRDPEPEERSMHGVRFRVVLHQRVCKKAWDEEHAALAADSLPIKKSRVVRRKSA